MPDQKVFISQPLPDRSEVEWTHTFADALREFGWSVFDEWSVEDHPPMETVREALRESNLVVLVLDDARVNTPTFLFYLGAAAQIDKPVVAVVPDSNRIGQPDFPLPTARRVIRSSPRDTAAEVFSRSTARLTA